MKKKLLGTGVAAVALLGCTGQAAAQQGYFTDRSVVFNPLVTGVSMPIDWGIDTAWPSRENMVRSLRFMGADIVSMARVSFQPWAEITEKGVLPQMLQDNLQARMDLVKLIGHPVDIALNLDAGEPTLWDVYKGNTVAWCNLIDATAAAVEQMGYNVASAAPFNEPDYEWNNTSRTEFYYILKRLRRDDYAEYPRFRNISLSGGNTLNCDRALEWYDALKNYLDEGNTHQLAGDFDHYAEFFETVRADGKRATADELHNTMEAMVGVEHGLERAIWWGAAELTRGKFCQASFGERLAYAENRPAWSSAAVYRSPNNETLAFVGQSERQAWPCNYHFVTPSTDVYYNGHGPVREYAVWLPGEVDAYQSPLQKNAEGCFNVGFGTDIQPEISGRYAIINKASLKALSAASLDNGADINIQPYGSNVLQQWELTQCPNDNGGDFSYFRITNADDATRALDLYNYNLDPEARMTIWDAVLGNNQLWAADYVGDGFFRLRNRHSALYLEALDNGTVSQNQLSTAENQLWRLMPTDVKPEFDAPDAPKHLAAQPHINGVELTWLPSTSPDVATYEIWRTDAKGFTNTINRGITACGYFDQTAVDAETYTYNIVAVDRCGNRSAASEAVDGQTSGERGLWWAQETVEPQGCALPYVALQRDEFTFTARLKGTEGPVFTSGVGTSDEGLWLGIADNKATLRLNDVEISGGTVPADVEIHLAATVSPNEMALYVNGEKVGEAQPPQQEDRERLVLTRLASAQDYNASLPHFNGTISDARLYNYAMTPVEVATSMTSGLSVPQTDVKTGSIEYFNTQGVKLTAPSATGITIVRERLSDGTFRTFKLSTH